VQSSAPPPEPSPFGDVDPRVAAQARLAAIIESSDDAIVSKTLEGVITSWNHGAERIFGWTAEEVIGKPITVIIPEDRLDEEPEILRRIGSGDRVDHFETIRQRKDGTLINVSVTISPVRGPDGRIIGASKIARDITAQKRYQQELQAAKDLAEQANRAKDHFLSVLSHELRTPLTPVLAAVSMLQEDPSLPPHVAEVVDMVRRNVETEARLVDDLLDLTRIARGKVRLHPEAVDAHATVRNVITMFQPEIDEKQLTLAAGLHAKQHHVWADPGRFQQIVLNLLSNAVKFTPAGGTITIRTSNENGSVKIEIADTGVGIAAEMLPKLFQPFEQGELGATRRFGGLGLGLSIVKSLAEMHHASISATSEGEGKGATFTLRVPVVAPTATGPNASGRVPEPERKQYRILLVEDHADTRKVLTKLLGTIGCAVTATGSVREAIEAADRQDFDLLVSDIGLPDGTGLDVMKHVAAHYPLRGIALSGYGQDDDLRRSQEAGFVAHLTKPVNLQALHEAIRKATAAAVE
jgi:PAS domain S-box-containing protein